MLLVEQRCQTLVHHSVVGVEALSFLVAEHTADYRLGVDGAERERLKAHEASELRRYVRHGEQRVLDAHAEATVEVQTRLVGYGHALHHRCPTILLAYLVRTLVHAEIRAYAVPRAMHEVHALAPHRRACHRVELRARCRAWEAEVLQRQVTLQH